MSAQGWMQGKHGGAPHLLRCGPLQVQVLHIFFAPTPDTAVARKSWLTASAQKVRAYLRAGRRRQAWLPWEAMLVWDESQEQGVFFGM